MIRPSLALPTALILIAVAACAPSSTLPATSGPPATSSPPATSTATPSPTPSSPSAPVSTPATLDFTTGETVLLHAPGEFGPGWQEIFALPYGDGEDQLGTSPGGEGLNWGPSYGAQMPDATWWFLDAANFRLAHFDDDGAYLGDAPLPEEHLANGEFFQWQWPLALSDGTLVLQSTTPDNPGLLRLSPDGAFSRVGMDAFVGALTTDGTLLYGFDEAGAPASVNPADGAIEPVDAFVGQDALSYSLRTEPGSLAVKRGSLALSIPLAAAEAPAATLNPAVEAVTGSDGVLTVLIIGYVELEPGEALEARAVLRVDESGRGTVEALPPLTSESDPGDGARLGVRLGDDRPWLMLIGTDALRVYRRG